MSALSVVADREGNIRIFLPADVLKAAAEACPALHRIDHPEEVTDFEVVDTEKFAREVVLALTDESNEQTALVHEMFDDAFEAVIDNGGEGFVWPSTAMPKG